MMFLSIALYLNEAEGKTDMNLIFVTYMTILFL